MQSAPIGVLDSGVRTNHPALSPRVTYNGFYLNSSTNNQNVDYVLEHGTAECENTRPLLADFRMLGEVAGSMRSGDWVVYLGDEDTAPVVAFDRRDSESLHVTYLVSIQA